MTVPVFVKTPKQEEAMRLLGGTSNRILLFGGSRCIHGDTNIETNEGKVTVKELFDRGQSFTVLAYDQVNDAFIYTPAKAPFIKGKSKLVKVTMSTGNSFKATEDHRVLVCTTYGSYGYMKVGGLHIGDRLVSMINVKLPSFESAITSIEKLEDEEVYYDFTVPKYHNYVAESIIHHNSGKTFILTYAMVYRALKCTSRHVIVRKISKSCKKAIIMDTFPKVMSICFPNVKYTIHSHEGYITFPNGSTIFTAGVDRPDQVESLLGTQFSTLYFNEASELAYENVQTLMSRLAENTGLINKVFFDLNPPTIAHWLYKWVMLRQDPATGQPVKGDFPWLQMNPVDNRDNLPPGYIEETLANLPERQRTRFLQGDWTTDDDRALWKREWIVNNRVSEAPDLYRIYVGIDPAVSNTAMSDETGIVIAGIAKDGHIYVLEECSLIGSPNEWAMRAVKAYHTWKADGLVVEVNNGGDLVKHTIQTVDKDKRIPIKEVRATRGKAVRAEPISSLYEKGEVHHVGELHGLEEQMVSWVPGEEDITGSPDKTDSLVWVITALLETRKRKAFVLTG